MGTKESDKAFTDKLFFFFFGIFASISFEMNQNGK